MFPPRICRGCWVSFAPDFCCWFPWYTPLVPSHGLVSSCIHVTQKASGSVFCSLHPTASTSGFRIEVSCRRSLFLRCCVLPVDDLNHALITQLGLIYIVFHVATSGNITPPCRRDSRYDEAFVSRAVPSMYRLSSQHQLFAATYPHAQALLSLLKRPNIYASLMFTTHRMQSPAFMSEKAWLIFSSGCL